VNAALLEVNMVQSRRRSGDASERDWRAYSALAASCRCYEMYPTRHCCSHRRRRWWW